MRAPFLLCVALASTLLSLSGHAQTAWPEAVRASLQAHQIPDSAVSVWVAPVDTGPVRLAIAADQPRLAASLMKLFTTGVALRQLGPAYTWRTEAGLGGPVDTAGTLHGLLYLRGSGDPALMPENLQRWLQRWRASGLQRVAGDIVIDRSAFELPAHDPAAFDGEGLKPYNAGADALLLAHQAVNLRIGPDVREPGGVAAALEPALDGVTLQSDLTGEPDAACGDWRRGLTLQLLPQTGGLTHGRSRWVVTLRGHYPLACGARDWPLLWPGSQADDHTARLLTATWTQVGGALDGVVSEGTWPVDLPVWQSWESPPLALAVRDINKFSNNVMARQLFLTLGRVPGSGPATLASARAVVSQHVRQATLAADGSSPCDGTALLIDNGSGLSRQAQTSASCLGRWLQTLWASPVMPEFVASLPVAGVDGTTRRWQGAVARGHVKTGSLDGVVGVAGYVLGDSGRRHAVVAIVQHPRAQQARPVLQAVLDWAQRDQ